MTLALRWTPTDAENEASGFIYFDAVTSFSEQHRGQVTKHPVDGGGRITDHFIKENSVYNISAVMSAVDVSDATFIIMDLDGVAPYNVDMVTEPVYIMQSNGLFDKVKSFIPNSIGQFIPNTEPEVVMQEERLDYLPYLKRVLQNLVTGRVYNQDTRQYDSNIQVVSLYEYDELKLTNIVRDLVVTSISIREDINTGYGLFCDLTLEKVDFVTLQKTQIPENIRSELQGKASGKVSKGKQDSTIGTAGDDGAPKDTDPLRAAVDEL